MLRRFCNALKEEFRDYHFKQLRLDMMAGLTVAAVALPLALAFGVSAGATASAGLITAVLGGLVIGALSGGAFQISGPTGAMGAVLILLTQKFGLEGVWLAGGMAGILLLITGCLKLGKFVTFIPAPVIVGFTSGIACIIGIGQLDNFFGTTTPGSESALVKLYYFVRGPIQVNEAAVLIGLIVIGIMIVWPAKWNKIVPSSLIGIAVSIFMCNIFQLNVGIIGEIPKTLLPQERLVWGSINLENLNELITAAISIAALCLIETLLCGEVGKKMANQDFDPNQELIAQGIGNMLLPFFGGIPATAAIARTSVGIKAGGQTRLTGIFHALFLLLSMFILSPIMSQIPLAALAGVLIMTAWRMNEWEKIHYMFKKGFKGAISKFLITMFATVMFDLTQAILIGIAFSIGLFLIKIANVDIVITEVDADRLKIAHKESLLFKEMKVVYLTGPLFFATTHKLKETILEISKAKVIIISMRGVSLIDITAIQMLNEIYETLKEQGCIMMLSGLQPDVKRNLIRAGFDRVIGEEMIFWSADQAIVATEQLGVITGNRRLSKVTNEE